MRLAYRIALIVALLSFGGSAFADSIMVSTPVGAQDTAGEPVSAQAIFTLSGTTLTIQLTNLQTGEKSAGQLLTDVFFTLSGSVPTLSSQTGNLITVGSGGVVTPDGTNAALGWGFGSATVNGNSGLELCVICQGGATAPATPSEGILGPAPYTGANKSIDGNGPHNPFVDQTATFILTGVSANATISNVSFSFGTTPGDNVAAPEPSSLAMLALGLMALLFFARRRRIPA